VRIRRRPLQTAQAMTDEVVEESSLPPEICGGFFAH
jgi:hypothetical protein